MLELLLLSLAASGRVPAAPVQSYDTYRSWLVACDNTLRCEAKGLTDGSGTADARVIRDAGPTGAIKLVIGAQQRFTLRDLRVDGRPVMFAPAAWKVDAADDETSISTTSPIHIRALLAKLRNGGRLTFGGGEAAVPLDGLTAALLRIDERQGRIGGTTALVRAGPTPASHVPAALAPPRVPKRRITARLSHGEAARLIARVRSQTSALRKAKDCMDQTADAPKAYALNARRAFVMLPCLRGAYQSSSLAFFVPRAGSSPATLADLATPYRGAEADDHTSGYLTEADFDPATGELTMLAKGRGLTDCGMAASWTWDGQAFRLASLLQQNACGGAEPGDWPTLYRSVP